MKKNIIFKIPLGLRSLLWIILSFCNHYALGQAPVTDTSEVWKNAQYTVLIESIEKENYEEAFENATMLAASGDSYGQCALSAMYIYGAGTYRNYESAQELLAKAAEQGNIRAEYMMGGFGSLKKMHDFMYLLTGEIDTSNDTGFWNQMMASSYSLPTNFKEAFKWFFLKDAQWGYRDIMYYCGIALITGQFGYTNTERGKEWIIRSAEMGYHEAIQYINNLQEN